MFTLPLQYMDSNRRLSTELSKSLRKKYECLVEKRLKDLMLIKLSDPAKV